MATTPNLGLHQWQPGDSFLRTDFNEDFGKIDTAIPRMVGGTYVGSGGAGKAVTVGFRPKLLLLMGVTGQNSYPSFALVTAEGAAWAELTANRTGDYSSMLTLTDDGFVLRRGDFMNKAGDTACYFAIG